MTGNAKNAKASSNFDAAPAKRRGIFTRQMMGQKNETGHICAMKESSQCLIDSQFSESPAPPNVQPEDITLLPRNIVHPEQQSDGSAAFYGFSLYVASFLLFSMLQRF